jgi:cephalosporin hydroxylase
MSHRDDRARFQAESAALAQRMGEDRALFEKSKGLMVEADKYKYSYLSTWLGVPILQLPADILALQEVVWQTKPDVIIETGVARGGSVIFFASLLELIGRGKVIGVDIDIRAHNRDTIENHPMAKRITLIEGGSSDEAVVAKVRDTISNGVSVMVILDSDHSRDHVLSELRSYGPLVTPGCYLVVADTMLGHLDADQTPRNRSKVWFKGNEPLSALKAYLAESDRFEVDSVINGKLVASSSPGGYLRCRGRSYDQGDSDCGERLLNNRGCSEKVAKTASLSDRDRAELVGRYRARFDHHGVDFRSLNVGDPAKYARQHAIHAAVGHLDGTTILDVGCGLAHFYEYLRTQSLNIRYIGYDVVDSFVASNSRRFPEATFRLIDISRDEIADRCDYIVMCQVFNNKYRDADNVTVVEGVIRKAFLATARGVSIDMLSTYVSRREDNLFYYSPEQIFGFAKTLTPYVSLLHGYVEHHFTVQLFKQRSEI